jgi:hypothetical protein
MMVYGLNVKPEWGYYPKVEALEGDVAKAKAIVTPDGGVSARTSSGKPLLDHSPQTGLVDCSAKPRPGTMILPMATSTLKPVVAALC